MTKKTKLPKTVFGVKIPKSLRKADWLNDVLHSESGRKLLADVLVAAAGAAAAALVAYRPSSDNVVETGEKAARKAKTAAGRTTGKLADTILELIPGPGSSSDRKNPASKPRRSPSRSRKIKAGSQAA